MYKGHNFVMASNCCSYENGNGKEGPLTCNANTLNWYCCVFLSFFRRFPFNLFLCGRRTHDGAFFAGIGPQAVFPRSEGRMAAVVDAARYTKTVARHLNPQKMNRGDWTQQHLDTQTIGPPTTIKLLCSRNPCRPRSSPKFSNKGILKKWSGFNCRGFN